jgi:hypothetical protein
MAFAITDDHERQRQVWKGLKSMSGIRPAEFPDRALAGVADCLELPTAVSSGSIWIRNNMSTTRLGLSNRGQTRC